MKKEWNPSSNEEDIWITPSEMGYKDRKMAKWQGFILSDHLELTKENDAKRKRGYPPKEQQSLEQISSLLKQAYLSQKNLIIQMNVIENDLYKENHYGIIAGINHHFIYIQTEHNLVPIELENIRHVDLGSSKKWYLGDDT